VEDFGGCDEVAAALSNRRQKQAVERSVLLHKGGEPVKWGVGDKRLTHITASPAKEQARLYEVRHDASLLLFVECLPKQKVKERCDISQTHKVCGGGEAKRLWHVSGKESVSAEGVGGGSGIPRRIPCAVAIPQKRKQNASPQVENHIRHRQNRAHTNAVSSALTRFTIGGFQHGQRLRKLPLARKRLNQR